VAVSLGNSYFLATIEAALQCSVFPWPEVIER
jgi:hypothetical protein